MPGLKHTKSLKDPIHLGCFSHIVTMKKEIDNLDFHGEKVLLRHFLRGICGSRELTCRL